MEAPGWMIEPAGTMLDFQPSLREAQACRSFHQYKPFLQLAPFIKDRILDGCATSDHRIG